MSPKNSTDTNRMFRTSTLHMPISVHPHFREEASLGVSLAGSPHHPEHSPGQWSHRGPGRPGTPILNGETLKQRIQRSVLSQCFPAPTSYETPLGVRLFVAQHGE